MSAASTTCARRLLRRVRVDRHRSAGRSPLAGYRSRRPRGLASAPDHRGPGRNRHDFAILASVDLDASDAAGEPLVMRVESFGPAWTARPTPPHEDLQYNRVQPGHSPKAPEQTLPVRTRSYATGDLNATVPPRIRADAERRATSAPADLFTVAHAAARRVPAHSRAAFRPGHVVGPARRVGSRRRAVSSAAASRKKHDDILPYKMAKLNTEGRHR